LSGGSGAHVGNHVETAVSTMPIEPLLPAVSDYLRKLGVVAVAVSVTNRVFHHHRSGRLQGCVLV
jgi:hypothetical protein